MKKYFIALVAVCLMFLWACSQKKPMVAYSGFVQGTTFNIKFYCGADSSIIKSGIDSIFKVMDKTASLYDSLSMVSKINDNLDFETSELFIRMFQKSQVVAMASSGSFDITVGPLVKAWGFWKKKGQDPDSLLIDSLKQWVGYQKVKLEGGKIVKESPRIQLDFNAIAQGFTVDLVSDFLITKGIGNYIIEIGGEVLASGMKESNKNWIVGIEKPAADKEAGQEIQEKVALKNKALATSGNYRKYFVKDGLRYSHTINPFTGYPVTHNMLSATVLANNCTDADAYATAFMVMGLEKSLEFLKDRSDMEAYFIVSDSSGNFVVHFTPGFEKFIVQN